MSIHKRTILSLALLGQLAYASTAAADDDVHQPFELGVFLGAHIFPDKSGLGRADTDPTDLSPATMLLFGARIGVGWSRLMFEAEVLGIPTHIQRSGGPSEFALGYRGQVRLNIIDHGTFQPFVVAGFGGISTFSSDEKVVPNDTDDFIHAGIGACIKLSEHVGLRLDGRILFPPAVFGDEHPTNPGSGDEKGSTGLDFEVMGGIYLALGGEKAAPPPPPPPPVVGDRDHDGIPDNIDKCPDDPEDKDGFQDEDGCPDPDNDQDGIPDTVDKCPNDPEYKDGFQDQDGCPDPDNDNDGIPDAKDKCPNEPETKNGYQDDDGCPDTIPAAVKKFTGIIQGINFATNKADITRNSQPILDRAVQVLKDYPDVRLEVGGHTDNVGGAAYNKDLSQRRAESVRNYMISKGIDASRLTAVGYGMDVPIADNKTNAGRAKNRRTEFKLIGSGGSVQTQ